MTILWIGLAFLLIVIALGLAIRLTANQKPTCPQCGSPDIHTHKEIADTQFTEQPGGGFGSQIVVHQEYTINGHCLSCGHRFKEKETNTR